MSEIERKFLVTALPRAARDPIVVEQGYLALDEHAEVRLRRLGGELRLTAKSGTGLVREEVEVAIEPRAFEALWPLTANRRLRKVRHHVPLPGELVAEVDVYAGALDGLLTAEVEFDSPLAAEYFSPPDWMGPEVTGDGRYANRTLATAGLPAEGPRRDDARVETDPTPGPDRAFKLRAGERAADGVRRAIAGRLDKAAERLREAGDGDAMAEAVHGARKDLKKARAALRLIRAELGGKAFRRENRALRDAGRLLSASRDAEVKLATLDALVAGEGDAPPAAAALWRDALIADRERIVAAPGGGDGATAGEDVGEGAAPGEGVAPGAGGGSGDGAAPGEVADAIEAVAARLPDLRIRAGGWDLLSPGLDTAYRQGREQFRALPDDPDSEAVHELRKRGKDLWYQVRLLSPAWPEVLEATATEIHDFTDKLGDHHDLAMLGEDLDGRDAVDGSSRATLHALIEARQAHLLAAAQGLGERIYAEKPRAFERRLHAIWRAWRRSAAAQAGPDRPA